MYKIKVENNPILFNAQLLSLQKDNVLCMQQTQHNHYLQRFKCTLSTCKARFEIFWNHKKNQSQKYF